MFTDLSGETHRALAIVTVLRLDGAFGSNT
jgi:hypothetical protein